MTKKRTFELSLILGLVFTFLLSLAGFDAKCANIEDNIFRLHIKANSNSDVDQQLKLKVRDNILELSEDLYEGANNKADAMNIASDNMDLILANAKNTIKDNGFDYSVSGEIKKSYFGTRVYENFTLPAGYYDSLKIYIGSGEGENCWCVLFQ